MKMKSIQHLVVAATLANGFLFGLNLNRALVAMPAWREAGVVGWARYSRHADLALQAAILYPLAAFSGVIVSIAAVWLFVRSPQRPRSLRIPLYTAALFAITGLLTTIKAAPFMLSLQHIDDDPLALQRAFDGFEFWGGVRGAFQILAYCANLWSLGAMLKAFRMSGETA